MKIGDRVVLCDDSRITGIVICTYFPTACQEQTLIRTDDGRQYHAPTMMWPSVNNTFDKFVEEYIEKRRLVK